MFDETGYAYYIRSMPGGMNRLLIIQALKEKAEAYDETSYKGLFNFLRYIEKIQYLEEHHATDEQFILVQGKAVLLTASRENDAFKIDVIPMEPNKVYNVLQGTWFNTITQKDTKLKYVQDAGTTTENSEYCDMTEVELSMVREKAKKALQ